MFLSDVEIKRVNAVVDEILEKVNINPCISSVYNEAKNILSDFILENRYTYKEIEQIGQFLYEAMLYNLQNPDKATDKDLIIYSILMIISRKMIDLNKKSIFQNQKGVPNNFNNNSRGV